MFSTLDAKNGVLRYNTAGEGFPILLLAGSPGNSANYLGVVIENLALTNKVIALHQRGTTHFFDIINSFIK